MRAAKYTLLLSTLVVLLGLLAPAALADTGTISTTVTTGDPLFVPGRVLNGCSDVWDDASPWHYKKLYVTVSQSGPYSFQDTNTPTDGFIGIYSGDVNVAALPASGQCMGTGADTFPPVNLVAGQTYTLLVTAFYANGTGGFNINWNGPGTINASPGVPPATPTITGITSSVPNAAFNVGDVIDIQVTFSEAVRYHSIGSSPSLTLNSGGSATCSGGDAICRGYPGSAVTTLTFTYTVGGGQNTPDLDVTALNLSSGAIKSAAFDIDANLTLPGGAASLAGGKNIVIDTIDPVITNVTSPTPDGDYDAGAVISIEVAFSEAMTVYLAPQLALNSGGTAVYSGGSGSSTLTFTYTVQPGDSSPDLDYTSTGALTGGVIIDAASNNANRVPPTPGAAGSLGANKAIVIHVPPKVTLALAPATVAETGGSAIVTATLDKLWAQAVTVNLLTGGAALNGTDYTLAASIVVPANTLSASATLTASPDTLYETDEAFTIDIDSVANGSEDGVQQVTGTITDDDAAPTASLAWDASASEGSTLGFTVNLSNASAFPVNVDFTVAGVTASGADYTVVTASPLVIPANALSGTITVSAAPDGIYDPGETFTVTLTASGSAATGTITDTNGAPAASLLSDMAANEGSPLTFIVTLSHLSAQPTNVAFTVADVTTSAADYTVVTASPLVIAANTLSGAITVSAAADAVHDPGETFTVTLTASGSAATGTIIDGSTPAFSIDSPTVGEGAGSGQFRVTLSMPSAVTVTVDYTFVDGSAGAADYSGTGGTLTFPPLTTELTIPFTVLDDALAEGDELFIVPLSNATGGAAVSIGVGQATITDDEGPAGLRTDSPTLAETAGGGQFTVTLNPASATTVTVDYTIADSTALDGVDYTAAALTGTLTFNPGDTALTVPFNVLDNALLDGSRTFTLTLSNNTGAALVNAAGTATITDDEAPPPPPPPPAVIVEAELPPPPPAARCTDLAFDDASAVRAVAPLDGDHVHCRVLAENGQYTYWLGSPLYDGGNIGILQVVQRGVIHAMDVFAADGAPFRGDVAVCLRGTGTLFYLAASGAPRVAVTLTPWTTPAWPGFICGTLYAPGTVVLVQGVDIAPVAADE